MSHEPIRLPALLESRQYAYHATLRQFLPSIALNGLHPGEGDQIFVEPDEEEAWIYLEPSGVMLRFPVDGFGCTKDGECVVHEPVPAAVIEVQRGTRWHNLQQWLRSEYQQ